MSHSPHGSFTIPPIGSNKGPACTYCGTPLSGNPKPNQMVCDNLTCVTRQKAAHALKARQDRAQKLERFENITRQRTAEIMAQTIARTGEADPAAVPHTIVRHNAVPAVPLSDERRGAFADVLSQVIAEGFSDAGDAFLENPEETFANRTADEPEDPLALNTACIACRGHCCMLGNMNNAFISARTIAHYRHITPDATPESTKAHYLSHIPDISLDRGCVYQGEQGCTLPRVMRADICNEYQCPGRAELKRQIAEKGADRAAVVAIAADHESHPEDRPGLHAEVSLNSDGTLLFHDDLTLPPLDKER